MVTVLVSLSDWGQRFLNKYWRLGKAIDTPSRSRISMILKLISSRTLKYSCHLVVLVKKYKKISAFLEDIREKFSRLVTANSVRGEEIQVVNARPLTPEEAIGRPERDDFPLLKGKEVMMEALFLGARGQAFTDMPGNFQGTVEDVLALPLKNNFERAVFVATLNEATLLQSLCIFHPFHEN